MRTLLISEVYPPLLGGTANKFSKRIGYYSPGTVGVVTRDTNGASAYDRDSPHPIKRVPLSSSGVIGWKWLAAVARYVCAAAPLVFNRQVRIIECARPLPEGLAGYLLARLLRRKFVINVQGEEVAVLQRYRVESRVMRRVLRAADLVIANSRYTERLVQSFAGPTVRTCVIWPGVNVDPAAWNADPEKVRELRASFRASSVLLTLGRLQARKGHDQVIRALPGIIRHYPNLCYIIVGSVQGGTENIQATLEALAEELGVRKHVTIVPDVPGQTLPLYYNACDLFVMPNRSEPGGDVEGFGQVFLEAGLAGKAVIGGDSGGVPDAIADGETGLLVDGTSVEAIRDAILRLLRDPVLAARMGEAGRRRAKEMDSLNSYRTYARFLDAIDPPANLRPAEVEIPASPALPASLVE